MIICFTRCVTEVLPALLYIDFWIASAVHWPLRSGLRGDQADPRSWLTNVVMVVKFWLFYFFIERHAWLNSLLAILLSLQGCERFLLLLQNFFWRNKIADLGLQLIHHLLLRGDLIADAFQSFRCFLIAFLQMSSLIPLALFIGLGF